MKADNKKDIKWPENSQPVWRKIIVESNIPDSLQPLRELSKNLWWVWNSRAEELFSYIDPKQWEELDNNPVLLLEEVSYKRFKQLEKDQHFISEMDEVYGQFKHYLEERNNLGSPQVAYFSMEYGL